MEHRISILFYVKKTKPNKKGLVPVFIRITINGQRLEQSIQRHVEASRWCAVSGKVKGNADDARQINLYLDTLTGKILKQEREMVQDGETVDVENFRKKRLGIAERPKMLMEVFQTHNDQMEALAKVGQDFSLATLERYNTSRDHTRAFLHWKYKVADMDIKKLDFEFVGDYEF